MYEFDRECVDLFCSCNNAWKIVFLSHKVQTETKSNHVLHDYILSLLETKKISK